MKYIKCIILLTLSFSSFCQETFTKSSIIKLNGDTLNGYISNFYDSKKIQFKESKKSKKQFLGPDQIKGFILNGNTYLSKSVFITSYSVNNSLREFSFIQDGLFLEKRLDIAPYKDTLFLQLIVKGKISLYQLTDIDGAKGLYAERNNKILELPPIHYEFKKDTARGYGYFDQNGILNRIPNFSGTYTQKNKYLDSLNYLIREEDNYYQTPKNIVVNYNLQDIASYIKSYNATVEPEKTIEVKLFKMKKRIYFGFLYGKIKPNYESLFSTYSSSMHSTQSNAFSVFALLPYYGANRNIAFRLGFQRYDYDVVVMERNNQIANFNRKISSISLGIRYMAVQGIIRPYLGASLSGMRETIGNFKFAVGFPLLPELGALIPVKKANLVLQLNMYPLLKTQEYFFRFGSLSLGLMF